MKKTNSRLPALLVAPALLALPLQAVAATQTPGKIGPGHWVNSPYFQIRDAFNSSFSDFTNYNGGFEAAWPRKEDGTPIYTDFDLVFSFRYKLAPDFSSKHPECNLSMHLAQFGPVRGSVVNGNDRAVFPLIESTFERNETVTGRYIPYIAGGQECVSNAVFGDYDVMNNQRLSDSYLYGSFTVMPVADTVYSWLEEAGDSTETLDALKDRYLVAKDLAAAQQIDRDRLGNLNEGLKGLIAELKTKESSGSLLPSERRMKKRIEQLQSTVDSLAQGQTPSVGVQQQGDALNDIIEVYRSRAVEQGRVLNIELNRLYTLKNDASVLGSEVQKEVDLQVSQTIDSIRDAEKSLGSFPEAQTPPCDWQTGRWDVGYAEATSEDVSVSQASSQDEACAKGRQQNFNFTYGDCKYKKPYISAENDVIQLKDFLPAKWSESGCSWENSQADGSGTVRFSGWATCTVQTFRCVRQYK